MLPLHETSLHLVSFDVPFPPNYGGIMDVFYKIKSLASCGVKITLHTFQYGRNKSSELEKYCEQVYYYKRKRMLNPLKGDMPYIVRSRENKELLTNLCKDTAPIIFEGLHTCFYLDHPLLSSRLKFVRTHNIEHEYYENLYKVERNPLKKMFFKKEAKRLNKFEGILKHANHLLCISKPDTLYYQNKRLPSVWVSAFHPNEYMDCLEGKGSYILYHGNLGVAENDHAALFLTKKVFKLTSLPTIIAGNNPSKELRKTIETLPHIQLLDKLTSDEILEYIKNAQINILTTFQATGIKLKLINSLYLGRHIVVNPPMVEHTSLESLCEIGNSPIELAEKLFMLWDKDFTNEDIKVRRKHLDNRFSNAAGAAKILDLLREKQNESVLL
jgi:hypothetical protein